MHPIIALWVHPRSMSTATERVMRERGDLTCFHEPFIRFYYESRSNRTLPMFEPDDRRPAAFEKVVAMLLEGASEGPVFFKDMSYYVWPMLTAHPEFVARVTHCFLIRDPRRALLSYFRLDPDFGFDEAGLVAQWQHARFIRAQTGQTPLVIEAEAIQTDPVGAMEAWWQQLGLPPSDQAFSWSADTVPDGWQSVKGWHASVLSSTGIRPESNRADLDEQWRNAVRIRPELAEYLTEHAAAHAHLKRWTHPPRGRTSPTD